jgi:thymidylate synthase (FAD)
MKIVKPSVTYIHSTPNPERVIERFGRICYQSDHKVKPCPVCCDSEGERLLLTPHVVCYKCDGTGTDIASAIDLINKIKANGHESVLEHASAGFSIITDRGVTHEIVRHRVGIAFSQESTRYCNYGNDRFGNELTVIEPPTLTPGAFGTRAKWTAAMATAESIYTALIAEGIAPQIARSVLPNSLKAEIGVTANFREWRHFLRLRTSPKAHPQMREIAEMLRIELLKISEVCFNDIP